MTFKHKLKSLNIILNYINIIRIHLANCKFLVYRYKFFSFSFDLLHNKYMHFTNMPLIITLLLNRISLHNSIIFIKNLITIIASQKNSI